MFAVKEIDVNPKIVYLLGCWYGGNVACFERGSSVSESSTRLLAQACQEKNVDRAQALDTPLLKPTNHLPFIDPRRQWSFYSQGYQDGKAIVSENPAQFCGPHRNTPVDIIYPSAIADQIKKTFPNPAATRMTALDPLTQRAALLVAGGLVLFMGARMIPLLAMAPKTRLILATPGIPILLAPLFDHF